MNELQFNGIHVCITLGVLVVGFVLGAVYGWLLRDDMLRKLHGRKDEETDNEQA